MLHHPTLDQLRHLKLHGMARAFAELGDNAQAGELDHAQWLACCSTEKRPNATTGD